MMNFILEKNACEMNRDELSNQKTLRQREYKNNCNYLNITTKIVEQVKRFRFQPLFCQTNT